MSLYSASRSFFVVKKCSIFLCKTLMAIFQYMDPSREWLQKLVVGELVFTKTVGNSQARRGEYLDLCDRKQDFRWTSVGREATRNFVGDLSGMQI